LPGFSSTSSFKGARPGVQLISASLRLYSVVLRCWPPCPSQSILSGIGRRFSGRSAQVSILNGPDALSNLLGNIWKTAQMFFLSGDSS